MSYREDIKQTPQPSTPTPTYPTSSSKVLCTVLIMSRTTWSYRIAFDRTLNHAITDLFVNQILSIFLGVLFSGPWLEWIYFVTKFTVLLLTWTDCKLANFCLYFFTHYSSTLLVMMSVEKCIVVYFPLKTRNICTVKTAKWACLVAAIAFAAFNSQWFFLIEAREWNEFMYCYYTTVADGYILTYNQINSTFYSFAPFAIMGLTNTGIIYKFIKAKMATESTNQALSKSAMRGTAILITISLTFIILTGPLSIYYLFVENSTDQIIPKALHLPRNLNHGINGLMYCIVGSKFRQELIELIYCRKKFSDRRGKSLTQAGVTQLPTISTISRRE